MKLIIDHPFHRMKRSYVALVIACLLIVPVSTVTLVTLTGCKTSVQTVAYQTLFGVEGAVNAAFSALTDLTVAGKVPVTTYTPVARDYNAFQQVMAVAVTAAQGNTSAVAPPEVITASNALLAKILTARGGN